MALLEVAITSIWRKDYAGEVSLKPCPAVLQTEGPVYSLFEQAKSLLNSSAQKQFGYFDADSNTRVLAGLTKNWQQQQITFLGWANKASAELQLSLSAAETPFEFTLVFARETLLEQQYVYIFALPLKRMQQLDADLAPIEVNVIDSSKLSFALRIHLEQLAQGSPKYLTQLTSRGASDLSTAFKNFSDFKPGIDIAAETEEFIGLVDSFSEGLDTDKQKAAKTELMQFCLAQDKIGVPIQLDEISAHIAEHTDDKSSTQFLDYVQSHQQQEKAEVHTDRAALKRYLRYFGRDNSLSINFSSERLGQDIFYQAESGSLRIDNIPKPLKKQLVGLALKSESKN